MTLEHPIWLLLIAPAAIVFVAWRPAARLLAALRIAFLLLVIVAMCGISISMRSRAGTAVVVADRSLSMPKQADGTERELTQTIASRRPSSSALRVVSFGHGARVELPGNFTMPPTEPESDLQRGIETALSLIPPGSPGSILVLTDGRWTGRDPSASMLAAADRGITIDYRLMERDDAGDLAIERVEPPSSVLRSEVFAIHASLAAPFDEDATVTLRRGEAIIATGRQHLTAGSNRIVIRDRAPAEGGLLSYTLTVTGDRNDPVPQNNQAHFLVGVTGPKPVLLASGAPASTFATALQNAGINVHVDANPKWTIEELSNYSAVVLENVAANSIGPAGMRNLAAWVTSAGGGLVVTGGRSSYAPGGYFKSPLEPILPVSMELRREHRKLRMSIVVAMDRSGSMAAPVDGGRTKMDLANVAAAQVLDMMSPQDELGVVAVDSRSHIIADLDPIEGRPDLRQRITSIQSAGGGIFIYEALSTAASMLVSAKSATRHILLFADAADSEEEGEYKELLDKCAKANITVSVIGLGTEDDKDAELLRDIARRGGGQIYFSEDAEDLPRLFAQDTFIVARSAFVDQATAVKPTAGLFSITGRSFANMPLVGGFNLCYLRDGAALDVFTADEYKAPLLASWQAGLGRVAAFTGEADGEYSGAFGQWNEAGAFYASIVRWAAGAGTELPNHMLATQRVIGGVQRVELQLDPERSDPGVATPDVTTVSGALGTNPAVTKTRMVWAGADTLRAEVPMSGDGTYVSSIEVPGAGRVTLPSVRLPYSPEYAPPDEQSGRRTLERIARATGGKERLDVTTLWSDLARRRQPVPLTNWAIGLALVILLIETLERRIALFPKVQWSRERRAVSAPQIRRAEKRAEAPKESVEPPSAAPEATNPLLDALDRANDRARKKMR
jgi:uncharacterized membrane protein